MEDKPDLFKAYNTPGPHVAHRRARGDDEVPESEVRGQHTDGTGDGIIATLDDDTGEPIPCFRVVGPPAPLNFFETDSHDPRIAEIVASLRLFIPRDQVVELRAVDVTSESYRRPHIESGFFDYENLQEMASEAIRISASAMGVYFTLNSLHPDLLSRRNNRI